MAERRRQRVEGGAEGGWGGWKRVAVVAAAGWGVSVVLIQGLVSISPEIYWDISPLAGLPAQAREATALGPRGVAVLMVLGVLSGAVGLAVCGWAKRRVRWGWVTLAAVGAAAAGYQMGQDGWSLFCGMSWVAAVFPAVAIAHLAGWAGVRRLAAGAVVGLAVSLAGQAFIYLWVEHPQTVAHFLAYEREVVAGHGWAWGSMQHEVFRRRLMSPEPAGPFSLSNVYASVLGAVSMGSLGVGLAVARGARQWGAWKRRLMSGVMVAIGLMAAAALVLTRSKGGVAAWGMGAVLTGVVMWAGRRAKGKRGKWIVVATVAAAVAVPVAVVLVRGAVVGVPADASGERSMLFRYFYWEAAGRLLREGGLRQWLVGMGPGGFKTAFMAAKRAICPEDVTSVHNVFLDYLVMLGAGGLAWGALLVWWLWEAGGGVNRWVEKEIWGGAGSSSVKGSFASLRALAASSAAAAAREETGGRELVMAAVVGGVGFGVAYLVQWPAMTVERAATLVGGAVMMVMTVRLLREVEGEMGWVVVGLLGGALVLMVHGQIEMTFFSPGAAGVAWGLMGLAAGVGAAKGEETEVRGQSEAGYGRVWAVAGAVVLGAGAGVVWVVYGWPVVREQGYLAEAADAAWRGELDMAAERLREAMEVLRYDGRPYQYRAMVLAAAAQRAMEEGKRRDAERYLEGARETVRMAMDRGVSGPGVLGTGVQVEELMGRLLRREEAWERAVAMQRMRVRYQPWSVQVRRGLADLLWQMGRLEEAREEYRRCLELSEQAYLDPLMQLSEESRREILERLSGRL